MAFRTFWLEFSPGVRYRIAHNQWRIMAKPGIGWWRLAWIPALYTLIAASACHKPTPTPVQFETGVASWYGHPFDGRPTASGETYDMEKLTAAHRTLAFGTIVRVHNLSNSQTVEVRVNDRGPFVKDRIIDLSHAAATTINMPGIANTQLQIIYAPPVRAADNFAVQVAMTPDRDEAERLRDQMEKQYGTASLAARGGESVIWRVLVGMEPSEGRAAALAASITGVSAADVFVVRLDPQ
jgi:rare lipoprotein A